MKILNVWEGKSINIEHSKIEGRNAHSMMCYRFVFKGLMIIVTKYIIVHWECIGIIGSHPYNYHPVLFVILLREVFQGVDSSCYIRTNVSVRRGII